MPGQIQKMALAALIFSEGFGKYFNVQFHRVHSPFLQRFFELLHSKKGSRLLKTVITERTLLFQENFVYCSFNSWRPIQSALCVKHPPWLKLDPAMALGTLAPMVSFCLMPICEEPEFFFPFRRFFFLLDCSKFPPSNLSGSLAKQNFSNGTKKKIYRSLAQEAPIFSS